MKIKMQTFSFWIEILKRPRSRKGAPGIVEVAARAGVSPATVSRAFNEPDMVREPTRVRIQRAADDLGYIRDRMAGALLNRFSGTIGMVVPTIDNAIFAELIEAFSVRLQHHDRTMLMASHGYDLGKEVSIIRSLLERRTDGVVLVGLDHEAVPLNMLKQRDVPVISVWNYKPDSTMPCVGIDNFKAGQLATRHVVSRGHRDIALLFPDTENNDRARGRMQGTLAALEEHNIRIPPERILHCPYDIGAAKSIASALLMQKSPDAIVCGNDIIAQGAMYASRASNLRVPEDVAVVGIGDFRGSEHMEPPLTTIRIPARRIGAAAADMIINMSENGIVPNPFHMEMPLELIDRGSA